MRATLTQSSKLGLVKSHVILMGFKMLLRLRQCGFLLAHLIVALQHSSQPHCCHIRTACFCRWAVQSAFLMEGAH